MLFYGELHKYVDMHFLYIVKRTLGHQSCLTGLILFFAVILLRHLLLTFPYSNMEKVSFIQLFGDFNVRKRIIYNQLQQTIPRLGSTMPMESDSDNSGL